MRRWLTAMVFMSLVCGLMPPLALAGEPQDQATLEVPKLRGFTITLALGEIEGGRSAGTFTPAATKALADLKDFLPYKSYRPLDTIWIIGLNGPHQFLRGPDGQKHQLYMHTALVSPTALKVDMLRLWDVPQTPPPVGGTPLLIDTAFNLNVGETVVVGTSRIDSGRGLILLVTAAPR
jgi:hypothetical protein